MAKGPLLLMPPLGVHVQKIHMLRCAVRWVILTIISQININDFIYISPFGHSLFCNCQYIRTQFAAVNGGLNRQSWQVSTHFMVQG